MVADVRVIAATNRDLKQRVAEGQFREDLYYRLSAFPIELPPLRERPSDIRRLARYFLERSAREIGKAGLTLSADAETVLMGYSWPGNVRELQNTMERVAILCEGTVEPGGRFPRRVLLVPCSSRTSNGRLSKKRCARTMEVALALPNSSGSACALCSTG
jgi:transcriptional regulator with GAF, ATPase, and Fis domain